MSFFLDPQDPRVAVFMRGISKVYPDGVVALRDVDFQVLKGEVHAVLGENGAGKTTLMRILYGEIKPTRGEIWVWGRRVSFSSPRDALANGIAMVYQNFTLIPNFTVFENIYLAVTSVQKAGRGEVRGRLAELTEKTGLNVDMDAVVEELPVGLQQRVEILKALMAGAKLLILDEPTSVLTPLETRALFEFIKALKAMGVTVILITHKLREVKAIADRVTVLRRGRLVGVFDANAVSEAELAKLMIGREVEATSRRPSGNVSEVALLVKDLYVRDDRGILRVKGATLEVRYGEIVGLAGVQGNGQKELLEAIVGLRKPERGRIYINGLDVTEKGVAYRRELGLAYIPDSRSEGLAYNMSIVENSVMNMLKQLFRKTPIIRWSKAEGVARRIVEEYGVVYRSLGDPVSSLSGGNQQKLMAGREVSIGPKILVAHEPTHGLDVSSANLVRSKLLELRDRGSAVLLASSDLDELLSLSDRILVIFDGRIIGWGKPEDLSEERLGLLMGGYVEA